MRQLDLAGCRATSRVCTVGSRSHEDPARGYATRSVKRGGTTMAVSTKVRRDAIVETLRPDPRSADTRLVVLRGLIGKSNEADHVRVFLDPALNVFIDIRENDILYAAELDKVASPLGGSLIWVNMNTVYAYGDPAEANRPRESFLNGRLRVFLRSQAPSTWGPDWFAFADATQGYDPNCPDPPTIWDNTPCQACTPVSSAFLPCAPGAPPQPDVRASRPTFDPRTGYERFNPYTR